MRIINEVQLDFDDVLIVPKRSKMSSRSQIELEREYTFRNSQQTWRGIPIIASNMSTTGSFAMAKALAEYQMLTALHKHYEVERLADFFLDNLSIWDRVFYTIGANEKDVDKLRHVSELIYTKATQRFTDQWPCQVDSFPKMLLIDVANGYQENFVEYVKRVREKYPDAILGCGNVCTPEMTEQLIISGADWIKIGVGGGSGCLTRKKTGIGVPQLSAVIGCADAAHGLGGHIISDGGCRTPADIVKAFAAGSDAIMLGYMLGGVDECEGRWINKEDEWMLKKVGRKSGGMFLVFYGMASEEAMNKYNGGVADYKAVEGRVVKVPYKGYVKDVVQDILGSIRSACSYVGAARLKDLSKCATFVRVNRTHNTIFEQ